MCVSVIYLPRCGPTRGLETPTRFITICWPLLAPSPKRTEQNLIRFFFIHSDVNGSSIAPLHAYKQPRGFGLGVPSPPPHPPDVSDPRKQRRVVGKLCCFLFCRKSCFTKNT